MKQKTLQVLVHILAFWLAGTGFALAQNAIESFNVAEQGSNIVIRVTTKEALKSPPASFTVANPARVVFDFPDTVNALGRNSQDIAKGEVRSMNMVQSGDRTRLVLNLSRSVSHEVSMDGRNMVITLATTSAAPAAAGQVSHFAEGKDGKHTIRDIDFRRG